MATHSSVLAWRTPGVGESGGLPSMGLHRVGHNWHDLAAAAARKNDYRAFVVKLLSHVQLCDSMDCSTPVSSVLYCLLEFAEIHGHWVSDAINLILCCPFPLQFFPASGSFSMKQFFTSGGQEYWSFNFISPSNEYSGLIYFRIYWFDLLTVQGTLKSHLQRHYLKASLVLSLLYGSTLTSVQHYRKNHNFWLKTNAFVGHLVNT